MTTDIPSATEPDEIGTLIAELEQITQQSERVQADSPSFEVADPLVEKLERARMRMESLFGSGDVPATVSRRFLASMIALERLLMEVDIDWDQQDQTQTASWRIIMANVASFAGRLLEAIPLPSSDSQPREPADTVPVNHGRSQKMTVPDIHYDTFLEAVGGCHDAWDSLLMHADHVRLPALRSIMANIIAAHRGLRSFVDERQDITPQLRINADKILNDFFPQLEAVADGSMSWQDFASASSPISGVTNPFYGLLNYLKNTRQNTGATETD